MLHSLRQVPNALQRGHMYAGDMQHQVEPLQRHSKAAGSASAEVHGGAHAACRSPQHPAPCVLQEHQAQSNELRQHSLRHRPTVLLRRTCSVVRDVALCNPRIG